MTDDVFARYPGFRARPEAMAMLTTLLRDRGLEADALAVGMAAIEAAPHSAAVRAAVTATLSRGVDRFHMPMLCDDMRNRAYARAIERAVRPGMRVLEIGTGGGLLAMIAARAGADVVTCEANPMVAATAMEIVRRNGLADRIRIVAKRSDLLRIPEDLPAPAELLMHEVFGAAVFDEGVVDAVADARRRLLVPGAPSVPPRVAVRVMLIREVKSRARRSLADVEGFDMSPFELLDRASRSIDIRQAGAIEPASAPHAVLAMDFNAPPPFGPSSQTVSIASHGGRVDGVIQWLAIDFGDGAVLENRPFVDGPISSWGVHFTRLPTPIDTIAGDVVDVTARHRKTLLTIDAAKRAVP